MSSPLRLLQVGIGSWGMTWLDVVDRSTLFQLAGVVSTHPETASQIATERSAQGYPDLATALEQREKFDAVLIVTPPESHAVVAVAALLAGLPVLIEKPLATTLEAARRIVAASESSGAIAMVSQNYRFKRAPRTVQRLISEGVIGDVQQVFVNFQKAPSFVGFRMEMEEPLIVDGMAHQLDQIRGVLGLEPRSLRARSWNPTWSDFAGNASVSLDVECLGGARVIYTASWASRGVTTSWDGDWDIQGTRGAISWRNNQITITFTSLFNTVFLAGALEESGVMRVTLDALEVEERLGVLAEFGRAIIANDRPETDVRDNIGSLQLALATLESARLDGQTISLKSNTDLLVG